MLAFPTLVLASCLVAVIFIPNESTAEKLTGHANMSCTPYQTQCALGCCPFQAAVCCSDGFECCQNGQTCIPFLGICLGLESNATGGFSLVSNKSTSVENLITACPAGYTVCGVDKCCRFPQATCCSDGNHCCPHGFRCDLPHKRCVRDSSNLISGFIGTKSVPAAKAIRKSPYKSCPGTHKICPSYTSCCIADNGQWSCCPNPSLSQLGVGGGECCDTIFGHMCCPDDFPHCTVFGCTNT